MAADPNPIALNHKPGRGRSRAPPHSCRVVQCCAATRCAMLRFHMPQADPPAERPRVVRARHLCAALATQAARGGRAARACTPPRRRTCAHSTHTHAQHIRVGTLTLTHTHARHTRVRALTHTLTLTRTRTAHPRAHTYAHARVRTPTPTRRTLHTRTHTRTHARTLSHTYSRAPTHTRARTRSHARTSARKHTHTSAPPHMHARTQVDADPDGSPELTALREMLQPHCDTRTALADAATASASASAMSQAEDVQVTVFFAWL
jgi:hypothetical protein